MENTEMLKEQIKKYVEEKGWPGFFGLLATISPEKIDVDDLKEYSAIEKPTEPTKIPNFDTFYTPITENKESIQEMQNLGLETASIYAKKHLDAVREDLIEASSTHMTGEEKHKSRVLENPSIPTQVVQETHNIAPNPWGDAKTVEPGEVKNMLTR